EQRDARLLLTGVVEALHSFNQRDVAERLVRAREAAEALLEQFERARPEPPNPATTALVQRDSRPSLLIRSVFGPDLFAAYCVTCHGREATGRVDGRPRAADLTAIARRHGGRFPRVGVVAIPGGAAGTAAHEPSGMPVWGSIFQALDPRDRWTAVRIDNLVEYLASIQRGSCGRSR